MDYTDQRIGIIGGGQLGKMMILEAKKMDFEVVILDPTVHCPADSITDEHIVAEFDDRDAIRELAEKSDVVTYEFEHIRVDILKELETEGYSIYPTPKSLEIIQNKYNQKQLLKAEGIPVPDFIRVSTIEDIKEAAAKFNYPIMLKSCTGGYDGKGNALIKDEDQIGESYQALGAGDNLLMVEEFVPFTKEISVLACRSTEGEIITYPIGENNHEESILIETKVPADISTTIKDKALELGQKVMNVFAGVGIFCIEMFVTKDGKVLINEIAPRPHNSGHYSIEGCVTSQFENHIRAIAELPLGSADLVNPAVMRNILGQEENKGEACVVGTKEVLQFPNLKLHVYGKKVSKPGRKMGHLTVTADTVEEATQMALEASSLVKVTGR
ncbi:MULTISPECIES: 5-(carboxyamino)imidazole ribonucleotide synthase [unclassified Candidatus Frackibacter]|uniref:5-(carboxyamino)imidazole ribonucleotide synthase n=1 Tax=unclassified Candidatus Frackibacter TaxID=2648818 RepID=UPI000889064B|nr:MULTISPECIES: 5-(carboxyamino)imidazole ribonucleotide synthase [unclassified Candidatus Frackibacter]SDC44539.1 5-(carboxyamino)imidazole ribonucleotide synthase [Candidatus Frackibacter sp. WG11]SEM64611.1 5-(carboxyamino)imidazole ribonucleotide synthase [Candidatus Frackibacter sp. WG12]SFL67937.1 5-(carboxyamino)imidazole ribonucleotide synthase [Candidatus Frackibacter sp. WG13]